MYERDEMLIDDRDEVFAMGTQNIHIKYYSEEIFHQNSVGVAVSIPHLHLKGTGFNFGEPSAIEITSSPATESDETDSSAAAHIKAIRLTPINPSQTRDGLTTEQAYNVSVIFTIDFLSGAIAIQPFSLYFQVKFIGIVEPTDEETEKSEE